MMSGSGGSDGRGESEQQGTLTVALAHGFSLLAKDPQLAIEQAAEILRIFPREAEAHALLGAARRRLGDHAGAIAALNAATKLSPFSAEAILERGLAEAAAGESNRALNSVSHALSLNPEHKGLEGFVAQLEMATGLKRPYFPPVIAKRYQIEQLLTRAAFALEQGRYDEAVSLSRQVHELDPENLAAWENLGTAWFAQGDYTRSLEAWERAIALEKSSARRALLAGYMKSIRKLLERPRVVARPAEPPRPVVAPHEIQKLYNRAVDLYTSGQLEAARDAFERVLSLDPAYIPASKGLRRVMEEIAQRGAP
jgi:tetratricopeptide (TPR) repeat protein